MIARIEHVNITVPDIDAAIGFLRCVDPAFRILHDSGGTGAYRWVHFGTEAGYVALEEPHDAQQTPGNRRSYADYGVNHVGLVVEDIAATAARLLAAGYAEGYRAEVHAARIRRYFNDHAGFEWELIEYLTDDPSQRFAYP